MSEHTSPTSGHDDGSTPEKAHKAGAFDVRNFIGALLGLYGLILLPTGLFATDDAALAKADGLNVNIWTGVALLIAGGVFIAWARLRPVVVPADPDDQPAGQGDDGQRPAH
ncbi:hypothetical protein G7072_05120 [Nocardioides sp. HDW12B]|uniref:hypothetical protein n=1 Tax=Nocardioides sp. HDW12B TaxID=2714939 RepID=UPI00140913D0|nr:hypothetical protein [Nocardioides sp. HDW12B]QIK65796.1 hypothetical protein G7072_05120 [Nocardioides sp. HDW12B]